MKGDTTWQHKYKRIVEEIHFKLFQRDSIITVKERFKFVIQEENDVTCKHLLLERLIEKHMLRCWQLATEFDPRTT
jgi:hypothetical protein